MRTSTFIVSMGMVLLLIGCGLFDSQRHAAEPEGEAAVFTPAEPETHPAEPDGEVSTTSAVVPESHFAEPEGEISTDTPSVTETHPAEPDGEVSTTSAVVSESHFAEPEGEVSAEPAVSPEAHPETVASYPVGYDGPSLIEERILKSPVIARVRLVSVASTVELGSTYQGMKHIALLDFSFSVMEYLKGDGADNIQAVWADSFYDSQQEAQDALPGIALARDARWVSHDAIIFLQHTSTNLPSTRQADRFFLATVHIVAGRRDDFYSLASRGNKLWLPSETAPGAASQPSGEQQRFLTDVPPATGTAPTITLGELKTRIASVAAKLDAGDGSNEFRQCVEDSYYSERRNRYHADTNPDWRYTGSNISPAHDHQFNSGLAGGTTLYELPADSDIAPSVPFQVWLDGGDSSLFDAATPSQNYRVTVERPLREGRYSFYFNHRGSYYNRCDGWSIRYEWTITVNAPEGVLHEAFFDPVMDGTAVAADETNGVLKPASFTDDGGAAATIERIEWESGTVKLEVSPHTGLSGHVLDFIELDGTVSLSLNADQATVDADNDTLSWSVASQPWEDGDELMVRVRQGPCWNNTAVPNPADNPGLMRDCIALLAAKDALRGTATLNWSVDTPISDWDGVKVSGSPVRVTSLVLVSEGLTGTIPPDLARLDGLEYLWLGYNQLTGEIPAALGGLASLKSLLFNRNRLTGAVPRELGGLSRLESLWLNENQLSGEIPASLGDLNNLRQLLLAGNRLSGAIPSVLGDLSNLEHLKLNYNQLTGEIPATLGRLSNLKDLLLGVNQLTGCIPPALRNVDDNDLDSLGLQDCATL